MSFSVAFLFFFHSPPDKASLVCFPARPPPHRRRAKKQNLPSLIRNRLLGPLLPAGFCSSYVIHDHLSGWNFWLLGSDSFDYKRRRAGGRDDAHVLSGREFVEREAHIKSWGDLFSISHGSRSTRTHTQQATPCQESPQRFRKATG